MAASGRQLRSSAVARTLELARRLQLSGGGGRPAASDATNYARALKTGHARGRRLAMRNNRRRRHRRR